MPGKSDEAKLAKLIRKNMAKAEAKPKAQKRRQYDPTLPPEVEQDEDSKQLFREMKKREF